MFKYYLYKLGQFIVNRLPLNVSYRLSSLLADLIYVFAFRDRRAVQNNLRKIIKNEKDVNLRAREVFRNFGKYLVEFFSINNMVDQNFIDGKVTIENLDIIDRELERGKGAVLLTAHLGNWELGAALLSYLGYPITAIAMPHKERPVNDLFNRQRASKGIRVVPTYLAFKACYDALARNGLVGLLADRDFSSKGRAMDFFGYKSKFPKGAAVFSQESGAAIIPVFLTRNDEDRFVLTVCEPIRPVRSNEEHAQKRAIAKIMHQYVAVIEGMVKKYPTQWMMFREMSVQ